MGDFCPQNCLMSFCSQILDPSLVSILINCDKLDVPAFTVPFSLSRMTINFVITLYVSLSWSLTIGNASMDSIKVT